MAKVPKRNANIVTKTQFNINGSRGKDVGGFITDYVAREDATNASMAYIPPVNRPIQAGDGVAFTLNNTAISKEETISIAEKVQDYHDRGGRAIEQMVISFSPEYLVEQGIVPEGIEIHHSGDYRYNYDDIRLRHAVRSGIHSMIENENYHNGNMVAAIQSDTLHLHAHAVVYEDFPEVGRKYGGEERGMIRESSLERLAYEIDRELNQSKCLDIVPTQRLLTPEIMERQEPKVVDLVSVEQNFVDHYLRILAEKERVGGRNKEANRLSPNHLRGVDDMVKSIQIDNKQI